MRSLADDLTAIARADLKHQTPPVDLDQFGACDDGIADRRRREMAHVDEDANRGHALVKLRLDEPPRCVLHQPDHHRRAEDAHATRAERLGGMLLTDYQRRLAAHADLKRHRANFLVNRMTTVLYPRLQTPQQRITDRTSRATLTRGGVGMRWLTGRSGAG